VSPDVRRDTRACAWVGSFWHAWFPPCWIAQSIRPRRRATRRCHSSGTGPKSGGGMRCFVPASYAEAMRRSVGSAKGRPTNMIPTDSFAGIGPTRRVPSRAAASRTRSNTCVVKPAGTDSVENRVVPAGPRQNSSCRPGDAGGGISRTRHRCGGAAQAGRGAARFERSRLCRGPQCCDRTSFC
jgi:hypothetical protein